MKQCKFISTVCPYIGDSLDSVLRSKQAKDLLYHPNPSLSNDSWMSEIISADITTNLFVSRMDRDECVLVPETEIRYFPVMKYDKQRNKHWQKHSKRIDYVVHDVKQNIRWGIETKRLFVDYMDSSKRYWTWDGVRRCIVKANKGIHEANSQVVEHDAWDMSVLHLLVGDSNIFNILQSHQHDVMEVCKEECDVVVVSHVLQRDMKFFRSHVIRPEIEQL